LDSGAHGRKNDPTGHASDVTLAHGEQTVSSSLVPPGHAAPAAAYFVIPSHTVHGVQTRSLVNDGGGSDGDTRVPVGQELQGAHTESLVALHPPAR
jgi:hypothetical protein